MITCTGTVHHGETRLTATGTGPTYVHAFAAAVDATDVGYRPQPANIEGGLRLLRAHDSGEMVPRQSNYAYYDQDLDGRPVIQIGWVDYTFRGPVKLWAVTAQVSVRLERQGWSSSRQVPTFYLNPTVQGITGPDTARAVAEDILHTLSGDDEDVSVSITVEPVY